MAPRSRSTRRLFTAAGLLLISVPAIGCATTLRELSVQQQAAWAPHEIPVTCSLTLQLKYSGDWMSDPIQSETVCIRAERRPIVVPSRIYVQFASFLAQERLCEGGTAEALGPSDSRKLFPQARRRCRWNGRYGGTTPFDVVLQTASSTVSLDDHVQRVRVFRNGRRVYRWRPAIADATWRLVIPASAIHDRGAPHLAEVDVRILPARAADQSSVIEAQWSWHAFFEDRHDNPPAFVDESVLPMKYEQSIKPYALGLWNAVSINPKRPDEVTFGAENLIPVVDLVGVRWNFDDSRYGGLQTGFGFAYFKDVTFDLDGRSHAVFNAATQFNVGVGPARLGVGVVLNGSSGQRASLRDGERVRLFVGVDLAKLFTAKDAEIF